LNRGVDWNFVDDGTCAAHARQRAPRWGLRAPNGRQPANNRFARKGSKSIAQGAFVNMRLPNFEAAVVDRSKICEYLLNGLHPVGGPKAQFFLRFGFSADQWQIFAERLRQLVVDNDVASSRSTNYGINYQVIGELLAPDGRVIRVTTIWHLEFGSEAPRLVTAYPEV